MGTNNGNKPKVDPQLGEEVRLKLLKDKPHIGESNYGKYFLYNVEDLSDGQAKSFFAPEYVHDAIQMSGLKSGSEFTIKKITQDDTNSGKPVVRLQLALVGAKSANNQDLSHTGGQDSLKEIMLSCVKDAVEIINSVKDQVPFQTSDIRSLAATLFIARTKQFA